MVNNRGGRNRGDFEDVYSRCEEWGNCRIWMGCTNSAGAPSMSINGKCVLVRRHVFLNLMGKKLRKGERVSARCLSPLCCSEHCLTAQTYARTQRQSHEFRRKSDPEYMLKKQRSAGQRQRLTLAIVREARNRIHSTPIDDLAREYGCHVRTLDAAIRGTTWRDPAFVRSVFDWRP